MLDADIVARYLEVVRVNRSANKWSIQRTYGGKFPRMQFRMPDEMLSDMLTQKLWLGSVAPADGRTDRIAFDIDAKTEQAQTDALGRYWRLRKAIGEHRQPLVYGTPSGYGLRVVYRIPRTRLRDIISGPNTGLVADALSASGMAPVNGVIELYPRTNQPDRLPLGRRMPLLDPATLLPLPNANIGDEYSESMLLGALAALERWTGSQDESLLPHLEDVARSTPTRAIITSTDRSQPVETLRDLIREPSADLPAASILFETGLTAAGTRQKAEWKIGAAFMSSPETYGLPTELTHHAIAEAIAVWLSEKHNGNSVDWSARFARSGGEVAATVESFVDDYLVRDKKGRTMVDRIALMVETPEPGSSFVLAVSPKEAEAVFRLAERHYAAGIIRYRFECWLFAWLLAIKATILDDRKKGQERFTRRTGADGTVRRYAIVELRSRRMADWPYGAGKTKKGQPSYVEFQSVLREEGIMLLHSPYRRAGYGGAKRDYANRFAVLPPNLELARDDVPFDVKRLRDCIGEHSINDEPLHIAVALHALYAFKRHPTSRDRGARYKRRGSEIIQAINARLNEIAAGYLAGNPEE